MKMQLRLDWHSCEREYLDRVDDGTVPPLTPVVAGKKNMHYRQQLSLNFFGDFEELTVLLFIEI